MRTKTERQLQPLRFTLAQTEVNGRRRMVVDLQPASQAQHDIYIYICIHHIKPQSVLSLINVKPKPCTHALCTHSYAHLLCTSFLFVFEKKNTFMQCYPSIQRTNTHQSMHMYVCVFAATSIGSGRGRVDREADTGTHTPTHTHTFCLPYLSPLPFQARSG